MVQTRSLIIYGPHLYRKYFVSLSLFPILLRETPAALHQIDLH